MFHGLKKTILISLIIFAGLAQAQTPEALTTKINTRSTELEPKVIEWRRHFHQYPELSNREVKTAQTIEKFLRELGMEVQTGIAHTGVVGILRGGKPGPTVALRADMDALPVTERVDLPFKSLEKGNYMGLPVGIMHACGHDSHMAMLMGAAQILSEMKADIPGTIKFIFQPAEEGAPKGEDGGAGMMVRQGVLKNPDVEAIFGIHINSQTEVGQIRYRPGGTMAAADIFRIQISGKQTHGSTPWTGVDPVIVATDIVQGLQKIVSRQMDLTENAVVITVGILQAGVRNNIISESAYMEGTIRTLDYGMQEDVHKRLIHTAQTIAAQHGAEVEIEIQKQTPVTYNDADLTAMMAPTLEKVAGKGNAQLRKAVTGAEDFAYYQLEVPGLFVFLGGMTKGTDPSTVAPHHTPDFQIDEAGMELGVRTYTLLALDYLFAKSN